MTPNTTIAFAVGLIFCAFHSIASAQQSRPTTGAPPSQAAHSASAATSPQASNSEFNALRASVDSLAREVERLKGELSSQSQRRDTSTTALLTATGVVLAATIAGAIALRTRRQQSSQERLLKSIEIIMQSRNGYQASLRAKNLEVFLDPATKEHLKDIKDSFSGPEYTDLRISLAQAMSEKATTSTDVLRIWKAVLDDKGAITRVKHP